MSESQVLALPGADGPGTHQGGSASRFAAFTPVWAWTVLTLAGSHYFDPMFMTPPDILGVPLGVAMGAVIVGWMAIGAAAVWSGRSPRVEFLILAVFTIPATVATVLGPALIPILMSLG
jgi:hypothetical protein